VTVGPTRSRARDEDPIVDAHGAAIAHHRFERAP
jgi:hypothetical protein